jgi:amidophosphoribosyltransferase
MAESDPCEATHQCGLAVLRLRKDLSYYEQKYGTALYGLHKMMLLVEKQHNRGQDGVGLAAVQADMPYGSPYIHIARTSGSNALKDLFQEINTAVERAGKPGTVTALKERCPFAAELFMGHLRYETAKTKREDQSHPFHRVSNWKTRNLVVAGNFNLTNFDALFEQSLRNGQHPLETTDMAILVERLAFKLDREVDLLHDQLTVIDKAEQDHLSVQESAALSGRHRTNQGISREIAARLDLPKLIQGASEGWDGGFALGVLLGHGDAIVLRDPNGIRPVWYYADEEVVAVASERPPIQTAFDLPSDRIQEIPPGHALIIRHDNTVEIVPVQPGARRTACSFERIYFSRPNDEDIYRERLALGRHLCDKVLEAIGRDLAHAVFTFVPNAGEISFLGLVEEIRRWVREEAKAKILALGPDVTPEALDAILAPQVRTEKAVVKDLKLRTFIAEEVERSNDIAHIYDVTYGTVRPGVDTLVAVDDSILRGSTMAHSILRMLDRLHPKAVVIVSSAPQIRYPDPYGIDMGHLGALVAFRAAVALLRESGRTDVLAKVYGDCVAFETSDNPAPPNAVKQVYAPFTADQISEKVAALLRSPGLTADLRVVYQSVEDVHRACPNHQGDWYFTGNYPTPGGAKVCNRAYVVWYSRTPDLPAAERRRESIIK